MHRPAETSSFEANVLLHRMQSGETLDEQSVRTLFTVFEAAERHMFRLIRNWLIILALVLVPLVLAKALFGWESGFLSFLIIPALCAPVLMYGRQDKLHLAIITATRCRHCNRAFNNLMNLKKARDDLHCPFCKAPDPLTAARADA